jgi:hypothetical protein
LRAGHIRQHRKKHQSQIQTSETLNSLSPFILHPFALILSRNLSLSFCLHPFVAMTGYSRCSPGSPRPSAMFRALGSFPSTNHDHGSSLVTITSFSDTRSRTRLFIFPLSDPGHTDTSLWIRPSRTILKDGAKRKMRSFCSRPPTALFTKHDQLFLSR